MAENANLYFNRFCICRQHQPSDGTPLAIKDPVPEHAAPLLITELQNEYAVPIAGQRSSLVQRLCRYLAPYGPPSWASGYGHLVRHLCANWHGCEVALVMDRTDLGQRWNILTLGVAYRKRLLPMTWRILPIGSTGEAVASRIHFYDDCEFRAVGLQHTIAVRSGIGTCASGTMYKDQTPEPLELPPRQ